MENIFIKLGIIVLLLHELTTQTQSAENRNPPFDNVNLDPSNPTHRISYEDVSETLDGSEPDDEVLSWTWTISNDESMRLKVTFHDFRLRKLYSILELGDGTIPGDDLYGVSYTKLAGFSGLVRPSTVISLNSSLWIQFKYLKGKTDWDYDFSMTVERVLSAADEQTLTLDNPTRNITSPNYPNEYPNNSYRLWTVHAPVGSVITVEVISFDLVSSSETHRLLIGDTSDRFLNVGGAIGSWVRWTGTKPTNDVFGVFHYRSQGPSIYVLFTTSYTSGGTGFSLKLRADFETTVTTQPTTTTSAPPTSTNIASPPPMCSCPSTNIFSTITTREATTGLHPGSSASPSADKMVSRECSTNKLFDLRFILVVIAAVTVLVTVSVSVGCYFQRRMNVNKLLITLKKNPDPDVPSKIRSVVNPVGSFGSDIGEVLYEGDECMTDIFPYGPIGYGRPSSTYTSYKGCVDGFGYQLPEPMQASRSSSGSALIHTYLDERPAPERRITDFQTFNRKHSYVA